MKRKSLAILAGVTILAGLIGIVGTAGSAEPAPPKCAGGEEATKVTAGIVQMVGCWTESTKDGAKVYTADLDKQPAYGDRQIRGVDLNGFLVGSAHPTSQLVVNSKTNEIRTKLAAEDGGIEAKLYTVGYPDPKNPTQMGEPFKINFTPPKSGSMLLEDFRFGNNGVYANTLDGFSPVGDVETPVMLGEDGTGSMNLTVQLAGIFTLKGKPQSVTILIPGKVGEGSKLDGFELKLAEIDAIKLINIHSLEAKYSAEEKTLGGGADFSLPFMGDRGVSFSFEIKDKLLSKGTVGVSGVKIPIGGAGFITALNGGFGFEPYENAYVLNLQAGATAEFGPEIPLPWGKVAPLEVSSNLKIGKKGQDFYFLFDGGVRVFRIEVGSVFLNIHSDSGVEFGASVGVGFPSFSNNPNDPFYVGAGVKGWIAKQRFQFEGWGKIHVVGLDLLEGDILINDRAVGACWKVAWFDGGMVYEYGRGAHDFGVSCGLGNYREAYPSAVRDGVAAISADRPRKLTTGRREVALTARGQGDAPRFKLTSSDGRSFAVPRGKDAIKGKDFMIVADRRNEKTHVLAAGLPNGRWTLTPYPDSVPIMGVRTGKALPPERVEARIVGKGLTRTLIWNSKGNPDTRLVFTEKMRGGFEQPILETGKIRGRHTFKVTKGSHYGQRRLRAYVVHGGGPREITIEDRFAVKRPGKLRAPGGIRAWRDVYDATATWRSVRGATGYVAEIAVKRNGRRVSSYRRKVGPKVRRIVIPNHPGGPVAVASVHALNADGVPGRAGTRRFRLAPPTSVTMRQAARRSAASAMRAGDRVKVRTICPIDGHCQTKVLLKLGDRTIARKTFQQVPGTYRNLELTPVSKPLRRRLAGGSLGGVRVVVRQHRSGSSAVTASRAP